MVETRARIRVVNPNSNSAVTAGIADGPEIVCSTLGEGPFGIETQADVESVTLPLRRLVEADNRSDAFVIACYSDPGLDRKSTRLNSSHIPLSRMPSSA